MLRQASGGRKAHLFGSCLFTHDWASTSNKKSWMDSTTVCDTSKTRRSRNAWPWPRHAQSDWVRLLKNRNWNWNSWSRKLESLPVTSVSVAVHEHLIRAGCMFFGTTRRTLTRLHRPRRQLVKPPSLFWEIRASACVLEKVSLFGHGALGLATRRRS